MGTPTNTSAKSARNDAALSFWLVLLGLELLAPDGTGQPEAHGRPDSGGCGAAGYVAVVGPGPMVALGETSCAFRVSLIFPCN